MREEWTCAKIETVLKQISETEIKQRLAELWEILIENNCQFQSRSQAFVKIETRARLSNPLLSKLDNRSDRCA
jgi:hypothetical protein